MRLGKTELGFFGILRALEEILQFAGELVTPDLREPQRAVPLAENGAIRADQIDGRHRRQHRNAALRLAQRAQQLEREIFVRRQRPQLMQPQQRRAGGSAPKKQGVNARSSPPITVWWTETW